MPWKVAALPFIPRLTPFFLQFKRSVPLLWQEHADDFEKHAIHGSLEGLEQKAPN